MFPVVRFYDSEARAEAAVEKLVGRNYSRDAIIVLRPAAAPASQEPAGEEAAPPPPPAAPDLSAVDRAVRDGLISERYRNVAKQALQKGRYVVAVDAPYGRSLTANELMDEAGPVDRETLPEYVSHNPSPLSDLLGLPVLTDGRSTTRLASSHFHFSKLIGLPLLSKKAAPFSSLFGMKTLSGKQRIGDSSLGLPTLSKKAAPFSSMIGMKVLTSGKKPRGRESSVERLSGDAAPFSDILGLPVLTDEKKKRQ
jgi:hypothetical protein